MKCDHVTVVAYRPMKLSVVYPNTANGKDEAAVVFLGALLKLHSFSVSVGLQFRLDNQVCDVTQLQLG